MHPVGQQQRRGSSTRMPMMYPTSLPPAPLLPPPTFRHGGIGTYQQPTSGSGGGGGGMKHHQPRGGNRGGRGSTITHRQQRPTTNSRYHPYPFRQPLPPQQQQQQRSYRPAQPLPRTPAALMGTPPGMSQSEYELIHSAQVQRDKKKLDVLAPSNTTQFLIRDHNRQTPSSVATPTPTHQTSSSPLATQNQPSVPYDQMFEMNEVDAQSDDTESNQDLGIGGVDPSFDNDFNDIYYQCRYERYAAFSRTTLLNEVLSLCANIDRLQHEKSEVEKRLRDVQQHLYNLTSASNGNQERSTIDETHQSHDDDSRMQSSLNDQQQNDSHNADDTNPIVADLQASTSSQPIGNEQNDNNELLVGENSSENNESEQQIVHD